MAEERMSVEGICSPPVMLSREEIEHVSIYKIRVLRADRDSGRVVYSMYHIDWIRNSEFWLFSVVLYFSVCVLTAHGYNVIRYMK